MLAKIINNAVAEYPYDYAHLQADNPYTRFADGNVTAAFDGTEAWQAGARLVEVAVAERPTHDERTERLQQAVPVLVDGQWIAGWNIVAKTDPEIADADAAKAASMRGERNAKLTASDWTQIADAPVNSLAWANYRQALRDLPAQQGFPWAVTWPVEP